MIRFCRALPAALLVVTVPAHGGLVVARVPVGMTDGGAKRWAHEGKPIRFWASDRKPGDTARDGFSSAWHVAG